MPKLAPQPARILIKVFKSFGYVEARQRGGHLAMTKPGVARPLIIPIHPRPVKVSVIASNLMSAGISRDEYLAALSRI